MDTSPIIIAGGGIAGLAAALALGRHEALVLEQAPAFTAVGAGIQIGPNAVRALQKLGAWDAVEPITTKPEEIHFRDGQSGKLLRRLKLGHDFAARYGAQYYVAPRAGLHAGLLQVVQSNKNVNVELGQALQHLELGQNDVQLRVKGQSWRTPALIVADGVQSGLRQMLFPGSTAVKPDVTFHRALVPLSNQLKAAADVVTVWMLPHGHVVCYCVGQPLHLNFVAITPSGEVPAQTFITATSNLSELLQHAKPFLSTWPALYVTPLPRWNLGNALLLGDAAHGTLPFMAQGAAMALEDAATLSQTITSAHSLRHAFAETSQRRTERTRRLHEETIKTGKLYHAKGLMKSIRNVGLIAAPNFLMQQKIDWLYKN